MIITYKKKKNSSTLRDEPIDYSGGRLSGSLAGCFSRMGSKKVFMAVKNSTIKNEILFEEAFMKARERQEKAIVKLFGKRIVEEVKDVYIKNLVEDSTREEITNISFIENPITFIQTIQTSYRIRTQNSSFNDIVDSITQSTYDDVNRSALYSCTEHLSKITRSYKKYSCARLFFNQPYFGNVPLFFMKLLSPLEYKYEEGSILNTLGYNRYASNSRVLLEDNYSYTVLSLTPRTRIRKPATLNEGILRGDMQVKVSLTDFENYFNMFGLLLSDVIEYYVTMKEILNEDIRQSKWVRIALNILDTLPGLRNISRFARIQSKIAEMNPIAMGSIKKNMITNLNY